MSKPTDEHFEAEALQEQIRAGFEAYPGPFDELRLMRQDIPGKFTVWREPGLSLEVETVADENMQNFLTESVSPKAILEAVCVYTSTSVDDIKFGDRKKLLVQARYYTSYLAREHTGLSFPAIAKLIGYEDHTSAIAAHRRVAERAQGQRSIEDRARTHSDLANIMTLARELQRSTQEDWVVNASRAEQIHVTAVTEQGLFTYPASVIHEQQARSLLVPPETLVMDSDARTAPIAMLCAKGYTALRLLGVRFPAERQLDTSS